MKVVPPFAVEGRQLISRRDSYFAGMRQTAAGGREVAPVRLGIYGPGSSGSETLRAEFRLLLTAQLGEGDLEATQAMLTPDGEKLFVFDRLMRQVTLQAVLYDTERNWTVGGETIVGRGHREWRRFYERARISRIAKSGEIVKLESDDATWRGAFVAQTLSRQAGDPTRLDLAATFLAVDSSGPAVVAKIPGLDVRGRLTAEGAVATGLSAALVVDAVAPTLPSAGTVVGSALRGVAATARRGYPAYEEVRA